MQVQFKNALFGLDVYRFAVVNDEVLTIVLKEGQIDLQFGSEAEAVAAQLELGDVITEATEKSVSVSDLLQEAAGVVSGLFGTAFGSVKAKASTVSSTAKAATSSFEEQVSKVVSQLETALDSVAETARKRTSASEANEVFGTNRSSAPVQDTTIFELSDSALRVAIDDKVSQLVETDTRVQALLSNLRQFHSDSEVEDVIQNHKDHIFRVARANDELTVNQLFAELLRSL